MAEKNIKSRIIHKHEKESDWLLATNFIPKQAEVIVYDIDDNYSYERIKIGDGVQNVNDLPFYTGSWENLSDKPFWSEGLTIVEWDGDTAGLAVSSDNSSYKVSDLKPSSSEVVGGKLTFRNGSVVEITPDVIEGQAYIISIYYGSVLINTSNGNAGDYSLNVTLPEPGIYFKKNSYNQLVSFSYGDETIYYLDEKFIPDTIARVSDISEQIAVDDALSDTSTNPVQNKVVNVAISNLNTLVGDTAVSEQINQAFVDHTSSHAPSDAEANVQSNWNENSDTSDAYILNKPSIAAGGGTSSIIEGDVSTNTAAGDYAHAEGTECSAGGVYSHAEGYMGNASGSMGHAEGRKCTASGYASHAEGTEAKAKGYASHAEGMGTIAGSSYQHVQGLYNIEDTEGVYMHIVGNGGGSSLRSNAHTLDKDGNAWFAGDIRVGGTSYNDATALLLATQEFVLKYVPKVTSITLRSDYWVFSSNAYYQDVALNCATPTSKVDLQPTHYQLAEWQADGLAFSTDSGDGIVRVWVTDVEPKEDITIQVTVQEVLEV